MNTVIGFIEEREEGWFFNIGNHHDKSIKNDDPLPDLETCYEKMKEYKFNSDAVLIPLVGGVIKEGDDIKVKCMSYDLYKLMP